MANSRQVPPRHLSYLFVAITLALATALVWLGIELVRQDRALETQRVRDDLQRAAVRVGEEHSRRIERVESELERLLTLPASARQAAMAEWGACLGPGAIVIDASPSGFSAAPENVLLYVPSPAGLTTLSPPEFDQAESLEFRSGDLAGAERAYRRLTHRDAELHPLRLSPAEKAALLAFLASLDGRIVEGSTRTRTR